MAQLRTSRLAFVHANEANATVVQQTQAVRSSGASSRALNLSLRFTAGNAQVVRAGRDRRPGSPSCAIYTLMRGDRCCASKVWV